MRLLTDECRIFAPIMKKEAAIALVVVCPLILSAGEFIAVTRDGCQADFNSFEGTHATLPAGYSVSKDGTNSMSAADSDFRGINDGNLSTGGCYAWEPAAGDRLLGYQPTSSEFTPGFFEAAFSNSSDRIFRFLKVEYDFVALNNENRSSKLQLQLHYEDGSMSTSGAATQATAADEDPNAVWTRRRLSYSIILKAPLQPGETFKLRWYADDSGGSGARDEYGIDNVYVNGVKNRGTVLTVR